MPIPNNPYPSTPYYDRAAHEKLKKGCDAVTDALNSEAGQIDDAIPPGTSTGHPYTDAALTIYQIGKFIWNGIFKK